VGASDAKLLVERWGGARWRIQPVPVPSGAQFSELLGVGCTKSSCIAIGDYVNSSGADVTLAEHWNGTTWAIQPTPNPSGAPFNVLLGVSCSAADACEAVGASGGSILAERWNGSRWSLQAVPAPRGAQSAQLFGVSCAVSSCEAVGIYQNSAGAFVALGEGWNGAAWHPQPVPNPARASTNYLSGVSCPSASDCTAAGQGNGDGTPIPLAERWRDGRWNIEAAPSPIGAAENQLNGITCPATDACMAVGAAGPTRGDTSTEALRWNGRDWRIEPIPNPAGSSSSFLFGVACPATDACTAVGTSDAKLLVERWGGSRWRIQAAPLPSGAQFSELNGVSCAAVAACIAVGDYVNSSGADVTLAERWNGSTWRIVPTPTPAGQPQNGLTGVACPGSAACIAVGTSFGPSGPAGTFAERWNGTSWTVQHTSTQRTQGAFLGAVWCQSATACIAAGSTSAGTLAERLSGTTWTVLPTPNPPGTQGDFFNNVSCTSLSACTAAGGTSSFPPQTLAERWNGLRWRIQPTPLIPGIHTLSSFGVACPAPSSCIAAGGFENDGPGSVSLTERWRGPGTPTAQTAPAAFSPRAYPGVAGCIREAIGASFSTRAAAARGGPIITAPVRQRSRPVSWAGRRTSPCRGA
jgi:hypothetical protein